MVNMKIIYACNFDLGTPGNIVFRIFHVAREAYRRDITKGEAIHWEKI